MAVLDHPMVLDCKDKCPIAVLCEPLKFPKRVLWPNAVFAVPLELLLLSDPVPMPVFDTTLPAPRPILIPFTQESFATPKPPATVSAPVVEDVELAVDGTLSTPPTTRR
jgi:hypothetical protein